MESQSDHHLLLLNFICYYRNYKAGEAKSDPLIRINETNKQPNMNYLNYKREPMNWIASEVIISTEESYGYQWIQHGTLLCCFLDDYHDFSWFIVPNYDMVTKKLNSAELVNELNW